jgi:hypothetical protein
MSYDTHYYKGIKMSQQHDALKTAFETYLAENEKFTHKGVKAAAARARKALQEIGKAVKERRKEITAEKEALAAATK